MVGKKNPFKNLQNRIEKIKSISSTYEEIVSSHFPIAFNEPNNLTKDEVRDLNSKIKSFEENLFQKIKANFLEVCTLIFNFDNHFKHVLFCICALFL